MPNSNEARSLDHVLVRGIAWTALFRWLAQLVSWVAMLYAARYLAPGDFGMVSMAMLAIGLARMAQEFGLDAIFVQDREIGGTTRARLAGLVLLLGVALFAVFLLVAPLVAGFFNEPNVRWLVMVLALLFLFDAIQVVPYAQLQRELQFRRLALVAFVQVCVTSIALVIAVSLKLGFWSLVVSKLAGEVAVTVLLLAWHPYPVAWPRQLDQLARPLLQGWRILASRIAWYGYTNADQTLIGRILGKDALGVYSFATTFSTVAQQEIGSIVSRVVPGIFSSLQQRPDQLRRYFLSLTEFLTLLTFPLTIGLALTADLVVPLVLGDKWDAVIAPLKLLCLYSAFVSSQSLLSHVLMWTGQFRAHMWCSIAAGVAMPIALYIGVGYGIEGVAFAWALVFPVINLPAFVIAFRTLRITSNDWLNAIGPAAIGCFAMVLAVNGARTLMPATWPLWMEAATAVAVGALVYPATVVSLFMPRLRAVHAFSRTLRGPVPA